MNSNCWNHMDILSSPFLLRGLIIAKYWNYLSSFILDELLTVEKKSKTKSKYNHICIKYINNHLTEIWTDMLGIKEHYCKSFFLFAEQIIDSTRVIQAKAFLTNVCIGDFVGWHCISQAADQKLIARIFVFVASWEKSHWLLFHCSDDFLERQDVWTSFAPCNFLCCTLVLVDIENKILFDQLVYVRAALKISLATLSKVNPAHFTFRNRAIPSIKLKERFGKPLDIYCIHP